MLSTKLRHFPERDPSGATEKHRQREALERDIAAYLAKGGTIQHYDIQPVPVQPKRSRQEQVAHMRRMGRFSSESRRHNA